MHPENAIDNGDFIKILVYKFILCFRRIQCKVLDRTVTIPQLHQTIKTDRPMRYRINPSALPSIGFNRPSSPASITVHTAPMHLNGSPPHSPNVAGTQHPFHFPKAPAAALRSSPLHGPHHYRIPSYYR